MPKIKTRNRAPFIITCYITILFGITSAILVSVWGNSIFHIRNYIVFILIFGVVCYLILSIAFRRYLFKLLNNIYSYVSKEETTSKDVSSRNIETLIKEIEVSAIEKQKEISTLKNRDSFRREFLGNLAHELKTPLFTIQGYVLTLLEGAAKDKNLREKYLERSYKAVKRLVYIAKDLDLITGLEVGELQLEYETFDIIQATKNIFEMLEIKATQKKISLNFDKTYPPTEVYADKEKIQQTITNLIDNSIKYGRTKGSTEVRIEDYGKRKIIVKISDNGEGIRKKDISRIFERFYRVERSRSRKEGGSGLGLAIVKHIIEAHDDEIFINSVHGVGTEFSFTLKKAKPTKIIQNQISQIINP